jgi:hypothetical protein
MVKAMASRSWHPICGAFRRGRKLDGVLSYSFLTDKIVLIDYPGVVSPCLTAPQTPAP